MDPSSSNDNGNLLRYLEAMGLPKAEATLAVQTLGKMASVRVLVDFIFASRVAPESEESFTGAGEQEATHTNKQRRVGSRWELRSSSDYSSVRLPNPMIGFGLPNEPGLTRTRSLPKVAFGPPFFYFENIARANPGVWETISEHLYGIAPEFFDSKYICATARKRGYLHNLPSNNRFQILPLPKPTICEALPLTKEWWPEWDTRTKLNCVVTSIPMPKTVRLIRKALEAEKGDLSEDTKAYVMGECKKNNLVWVGKNSAAALEPYEIETLLGFPVNHTRGGYSRNHRYKSLGNSFQVDTVAYHLSVLKPLFPTGLNVLSLFSGIGGAEVALHRLQIPIKTVVSAEISENNRNILRSFWEQTDQKGDLIEFVDVKLLTKQKIEELMDQIGGFDLVIGGSPCDNLAGKNRKTRTGLVGEKSVLFFEYCRILKVVREKAARMSTS